MKPSFTTIIARLAAVLAAVLLLGGCQTTRPVESTPAAGHIEQALEANRRQGNLQGQEQTLPAEVREALLPQLNTLLPSAGKAPAELRYDINVANTPARDFFLGLVENTPYNMVVHPEVAGEITLNLKNVTIPEVMDVVRDVYGYAYQPTASGYYVMPVRLRSKIFHVDYLNLLRSGSSNTVVQSGGAGSTSGSDSGTGSTTSAGGSGSTSITTQQPESAFWNELVASVRAIIGEEAGRSVAVNPQSGILVVRAMPIELKEVEEFLASTEESVGRQVILEAKILEVGLDDGHQTGIDWAFLNRSSQSGIVASQSSGGSALDVIEPTTGAYDPFDRTSGLGSAAFGGLFSAALYYRNFAAFIELLQTQGDVRVLSSPRISTLNNQKAVIKVGSDEYFVTDVSSQSTTSTSGNTTTDIQLTPFFSGVSLDVTPQVSTDGIVTLHIHPTVVEVTDQVKTFTVFGLDQTLPLAYSTSRESDSVVRARSGQVIVIGGLLKEEMQDTKQAPPVVGELPLVGSLFQHRTKTSTKSELVILLRPLVVSGNHDWDAAMRPAMERIRHIEKVQSRTPATGP